MKSYHNIIALLLMTLIAVPASAAEDWFVETMYSSGKIYVVVAVAGVVLAGIFAYLIWLDSRLRKLEDENQQPE